MNVLLHKIILIADDVPLNLVILGQVLQAAGATVLAATNGKEALALLENNTAHSIDIVLTDLQMPEMDGWEMAVCIRQSNKWYRHLPIIATTAETEEAEMQKCFTSGINEVIHKPVIPAIVYRKIEAVLEGTNKPYLPVAMQTHTVAAFDLSYLLEVTNQDKENLLLMVNNLKENAPLLLGQSATLVHKKEWNGVAAHLHKLKGLTTLFGMHTTTKALLEAEQEAGYERPSVEQLLKKIKLISLQLTDFIPQIFEQLHLN